MKVLVDSNVVLNKLLNQAKFFAGSNAVFNLAEDNTITGYISASAVTDIYYIASKTLGKKTALAELKKILQVFKPATVTDNHIYQALDLDWDDFEDSVQYVVGESFSADYIVTRNTQDYTSSYIPVVTPEQFIKAITTDEDE